MSRQNYYKQRKARQRRQVDGDLLAELVQEERQLQPRLGVRKLQVVLKDKLAQGGVEMGRDRMFEELRARGLLLEAVRSFYPRTTNSRHSLPVFGNLVQDKELTKPHQVWVGDVTYLRTQEGFLYLALLTDKKSRKIVGYHCGDSLEATGCIKALEMALLSLPPGKKPIHHSDRGCQYCSHEYVQRLQEQGLGISMTQTNHTAENALAERMNGILKMEYRLGMEFRTKEQARKAVHQAVYLYNTRRPHRSLGLRVPEAVHSLAE